MKQAKAIFLKILIAVFLTAAVFALDVSTDKTPSEKLAVHILDVGQGDSIFVELPNGETMLVDTGDAYHGESILRYIRNTGKQRIDYLVATHPHADHIGSMAYIVRHFDVGSVCMPEVTTTTAPYERLLEAIGQKHLPVKKGRAGVSLLCTEDFSADILAPVTLDGDNLNNCSLVIKLTYGTRSVLLTGDAEHEETEALTADIRADVLKVPHHGSADATDEALLQRIQPSIAVISCGRDNEYGFPHEKTLRLLDEAGAAVYRTDKDYTVVVTTDGKDLTVSTSQISMKRTG